jgi:hypothetical protein
VRRRLISRSAGVPSMISSFATPATGEPRNPRGESPQASSVLNPTAASRSQISGTSTMSIQWYWMFWRSVMSAVLRAKSEEIPPSVRRASALSSAPSLRTRIMK